MASVVEFLIKMQDGLTSPLAKITQTSGNAKTALGRLTDSNKQLQSMVGKSSVSVNDLTNRIAKLKELRDMLPAGAEQKIRNYNSEINRLTASIQKMQTMNGSQMKVWMKDAFDGLPQLARNPLVAVGVAVAHSINEGMKQSKEQLDFKLLVGSDAAEDIYGGVKKMKRFYGEEAGAGAKKLVQSGTSAEQVSPMLENIGKVASGDVGKFSGLVAAFGQVQKEGALTESTLAAMNDNGFKPLTLLQKTFGKDTAHWQKELANGHITINELNKALQDATDKGGIFANTLAEIEASPTGLWNRLTTGVSELSGVVGSLLLPVLTPVFQVLNFGLDLAIGGFNGLKQLIVDNSDALGILGGIIGGVSIAWMVYQGWVRLAWMWQMKDLIGTYLLTTAKGAQTVVIGGLTTAWVGLTTAMAANPIGAILIAIVAVVGGIILMATKFEWARKIVYGVWEVIKAIGENIATFFENLFGGGNKKYVAIDVAYKKGEDDASAEFAAKKQGLADDPVKELLDYQTKQDKTNNQTTANASEGINAVSGGGAKNITISIGKMVEKLEIRIVGGTQQVAQEMEQMIEEVMVRAIASASHRN
jgi:flagellar basal body-associated protein FliL